MTDDGRPFYQTLMAFLIISLWPIFTVVVIVTILLADVIIYIVLEFWSMFILDPFTAISETTSRGCYCLDSSSPFNSHIFTSQLWIRECCPLVRFSGLVFQAFEKLQTILIQVSRNRMDSFRRK